MNCPKCGGVLEKRFFKEHVLWFCVVCNRGFPEPWLNAVKEETDMTLDFCEKVLKDGRSC